MILAKEIKSRTVTVLVLLALHIPECQAATNVEQHASNLIARETQELQAQAFVHHVCLHKECHLTENLVRQSLHVQFVKREVKSPCNALDQHVIQDPSQLLMEIANSAHHSEDQCRVEELVEDIVENSNAHKDSDSTLMVSVFHADHSKLSHWMVDHAYHVVVQINSLTLQELVDNAHKVLG